MRRTPAVRLHIAYQDLLADGSLRIRARVGVEGSENVWRTCDTIDRGRHHSVLAVLPEEEGKAAKRFTVNFFSTDGQYDKERAAAKQPKKKMRPNPLDKVRAARS